MTVQNACLIFIVCFSAITGWLMFREPASISVSSVDAPAAKKSVSAQTPEPTAADVPSEVAEHTPASLDTLVIPVLDFREVALEEVVDFLNLKVREMEGSGRNYQFVISKAQDTVSMDAENTVSLYLEDVTFTEALNVICEEADCRWELSDGGVVRIFSVEE